MDRDEILASAKSDKGRTNEFENRIGLKSGLLGSFVSLVAVILFLLVEFKIRGTVNLGFPAIVFFGNCADRLFIGIKTGKRIAIVTGVLSGLFAIILSLAFFKQMVAA